MSESMDGVMRKVRGLLAKSERTSSAEEAATALGLAQKLMAAHGITRAEAELAGATKAEAVVDFSEAGDPLLSYSKLDTWLWRLASAVAQQNGCYLFASTRRATKGRTLEIVGRPTQVEGVRYLVAYIRGQIDRLAGEHRGAGRTFINNFRHGCVDTVSARLKEAQAAAEQEAREVAAPAAPWPLRVEIDSAMFEVQRDGDRAGIFIDGRFLGQVFLDSSGFSYDLVASMELTERVRAVLDPMILARLSAGQAWASQESRGVALARVEKAIAKTHEEYATVAAFTKEKHRLVTRSSGGGGAYDPDGRSAGRTAGSSIDLGGRSKGGLTGGHKRLGGGK